MGKKTKKFFKKELMRLFKSNKVLIAAVSGAATGIVVANILGTGKARNILHTVGNSLSNATDRISDGFKNIKNGNVRLESRSRETVQS